jgi:hypothetical protein
LKLRTSQLASTFKPNALRTFSQGLDAVRHLGLDGIRTEFGSNWNCPGGIQLCCLVLHTTLPARRRAFGRLRRHVDNNKQHKDITNKTSDNEMSDHVMHFDSVAVS